MSISYQSWEMVSGPAMGLNMSPQRNGCSYLVGKTRLPDDAIASQDTVTQGMSSLSIRMLPEPEGETCLENCKFVSSCSKFLEMNSAQFDGVSESPEHVTSFMGVEENSLAHANHLRVTHTIPHYSQTSAQCAQVESEQVTRAKNSDLSGKFFLRSPRDCTSFSSFHLGSMYTLGVVTEDKPWEDSTASTHENLELDTFSTSSKSYFSYSDDLQIGDTPSTEGQCVTADGEVQSAYNGPSNLSGGTSPPRKGLSRFYAGKSRSFSCLGDVMSVKDIAKPENPYAKKRKCSPGRSMKASSRTQLPPLQKGTACISKKPLHSGKSTLALAVVMRAREDAIVVENNENKNLGVQKWHREPLPSRSYSLSDLQGSDGELSVQSSFH